MTSLQHKTTNITLLQALLLLSQRIFTALKSSCHPDDNVGCTSQTMPTNNIVQHTSIIYANIQAYHW